MFGGALESQLTPKNATRHITYRRPGHLHLMISTPKVLNHREISTTTRGLAPADVPAADHPLAVGRVAVEQHRQGAPVEPCELLPLVGLSTAATHYRHIATAGSIQAAAS
jgi:hypothetical protein